MDGIFISYRRDDSAGYAGRLYDRLVAHFGADRVFMDVEGIEPGLDFVDAIEEAVGSCRVLIAVIGDEWITSTDAAGRRRLDDPNDFIRLETGSALKRGIRVVPVLVGGAVMPRIEELPEDLKSLTRRQAIEINHKQWEASTGELIRTLENILKTTDKSPAAAREATNGASTHEATAQGSAKSWVWPVAVGGAVIAVIAVAGLWKILGDRKTGGGTEIHRVPKTVEAPATTTASRTPVTGPTVTSPAASPKPAPAPAAATPALAPVIREFKAVAATRRARLCYQVSNAESVILSPRPGELNNSTEDCVNVELESATIFTLTARSGDKTARKSLTLEPKPATADAPVHVAAPAVAPATAPRPDAVPAAATSTRPQKGERWVYQSSGKWRTSPKRRFEIVAQSVADGLVTDELRSIDPAESAEVRRARGDKPDFIDWRVIGPEFSPYLSAYVDLAQQRSFSNLPTPDMGTYWRDWHSQAKVIGRESVSVPAGRFNAFKMEVWSSRHSTGSIAEAQVEPVRVQYFIWYAPEAKRYVRMERRITTAGNTESEKDVFELVAHQLP